METTSRSDKFWNSLNHFRTSRWGILMFYAYLGGILVAAFIAAFAIKGNHNIAVKANNAAQQAKSAATIATRSLCFQKRANLAQLRGTRLFLKNHPNGTVDFSRALILNAIKNDEIDVAALRDVRCAGIPR